MKASILWFIGLVVSIFLIGFCIYEKEGAAGAATLPLQEIQPEQAIEMHPANQAIDDLICEELPWEMVEGIFDPADIPESEISYEEMVSEVVALWEKFFEIDGAPSRDWRRTNFDRYARYVVDAVVTFQNKDPGEKFRLPRHDSSHLLIATIITKEASINSKVIGSRGEVGLMQIMPHGPAMGGLKKSQVIGRPKIQIFLGVRWLARQIKTCYPKGVSDEEWTDEHWLGPLSVYGGGNNGISKRTGKCRKNLLRDRVTLMQMYRDFIREDIYKESRN